MRSSERKRRCSAEGFELPRGQTQGVYFLRADKGPVPEEKLHSTLVHVLHLHAPPHSCLSFPSPAARQRAAGALPWGEQPAGHPTSHPTPWGAPRELPPARSLPGGGGDPQGAGMGPAARPRAPAHRPVWVHPIPTCEAASGSQNRRTISLSSPRPTVTGSLPCRVNPCWSGPAQLLPVRQPRGPWVPPLQAPGCCGTGQRGDAGDPSRCSAFVFRFLSCPLPRPVSCSL